MGNSKIPLKVINNILNYNWSKSHTRELPLFTMEVAAYGYVILLKKLTGWSYRHVLNIFQNGIEYAYRDLDDDSRLIKLFSQSNQKKLLLIFKTENRRVLIAGNRLIKLLSSPDFCKSNVVVDNILQIHEIYGGVAAVLGITRPAGIFYDNNNSHSIIAKQYAKIRYDQARLYNKIENALDIFFGNLALLLGMKASLLKYCTAAELASLCQGKNIISSHEMVQRRKTSILYYSKNEVKIWSGVKARQFARQIKNQKNLANFSVINGRPVYPGRVKGKVLVVLKKKDLKFLRQRDILVTPMTQISFMPYLPMVSAIITDEGGVTCHAAIIARELKIPCIIATKIASQVLKNGDVINVDANLGVIKRVENKKNGKH